MLFLNENSLTKASNQNAQQRIITHCKSLLVRGKQTSAFVIFTFFIHKNNYKEVCQKLPSVYKNALNCTWHNSWISSSGVTFSINIIVRV